MAKRNAEHFRTEDVHAGMAWLREHPHGYVTILRKDGTVSGCISYGGPPTCLVCHGELPDHDTDCEIAKLTRRAEEAEAKVEEAAKIAEFATLEWYEGDPRAVIARRIRALKTR